MCQSQADFSLLILNCKPCPPSHSLSQTPKKWMSSRSLLQAQNRQFEVTIATWEWLPAAPIPFPLCFCFLSVCIFCCLSFLGMEPGASPVQGRPFAMEPYPSPVCHIFQEGSTPVIKQNVTKTFAFSTGVSFRVLLLPRRQFSSP